MLLAVDIGNTVTHLGLFNNKSITKHICLKTKNIRDRFSKIIRKWNFSDVIVSTVVPGAIPKFNVPVLVVNHKLDLGLKIKYKYPQNVGGDRLANAVAVRYLYGYPAIVIDFGTAITIDVISKKGDYLGGVIMPGLNMIRHGLKDNTALLPLVSFEKPKKILGETTIDAIRSGIYYGIRGMIKELIMGLKKELHLPPKTVIINTGGDAGLLGVGKIDNLLTLKGLRLIYERNQNHGF